MFQQIRFVENKKGFIKKYKSTKMIFLCFQGTTRPNSNLTSDEDTQQRKRRQNDLKEDHLNREESNAVGHPKDKKNRQFENEQEDFEIRESKKKEQSF